MYFLPKHKRRITTILIFIFVFSFTYSFQSKKIFAQQNEHQGQDTVDAGLVATDNSNKEKDFGCFNGAEGTSRIAGCTAAITYYLMFKPAYWVMSVASLFFNYVLLQLVVGMGVLVNDQMPSVMVAWAALRDIANVFLVFLTVYVGIATILGISGYGYKQLLWRIILAALFVNFSSTFTKFIIDVSNMAAIQTYSMFMQTSEGNGNTIDSSCLNPQFKQITTLDNGDPCVDKGIAAALWSAMKITSTFNVKTLMDKHQNIKGKDLQWNMAFTAIMSAILFTVMAFLFMGAGFLLVGRFVILIFMLIVSPIALVAWLTKTSSVGRQWWHTLLNQALFAPLLLLMWWIAYVILTDYMEQISPEHFSEAGVANSISGIATATVFIIIISFFIAGMILAKNMGAYGASAIMKTGSKWVRGAAVGITGGALAYSAGTASSMAARAYRRKMAEAQEVDEEGNYKHKSIYHRGLQKLAGGKVDRAMNAALSSGMNKRFMGTKSLTERKAHTIKAEKERMDALQKESKDMKIDRAIKTLNNPDERLAKAMGVETERSVNARQVIAKAGKDEIVEAQTRNKKAFKTDAIKSSLTKEQAIELSKNTYRPQEKSELKKIAYKNEISALRGKVPESEKEKDGSDKEKIKRTVRGMSVADVRANIRDFTKNLNENVKHISQKTYNEILENKDGALSSVDLNQIKTARENHLKNLTGTELEKELGEMDYQTMANMDKDFLSRPDVVEHLDTRTLNEMIKKGLTKEKREAIKKTIREKYKTIQHKDSNGVILDKTGSVASTKQKLSGKERNIASLYKWFNEDSGSTRPLV